MSELSKFLTSRGFHQVPLTQSIVGHFHTQGTLNGREVEILVDTGASCTCVSFALVEALGLHAQKLETAAAAAGGEMEQYVVDGVDLRLGSFAPRPVSMAGLDFEHVNAPLRAQGSQEVDMILGVDVFAPHQAVIDYATESLFLKVEP